MSGRSKKKPPPWLRLVLAAAITETLYFLMTAWSNSHARGDGLAFEQTLLFFALWTGLFVFYAIAIHAIRDVRHKGMIVFIGATSILFRATLIPATGLAQSGQLEIPGDLDSLLYPLAPLVHSLADQLPRLGIATGDVLSIKVAAAIFDIAALLFMPALLKSAGFPAALAIIYGWSPLAIKESAGSGHLEPLGLAFLVIAILTLQSRSRLKSALSYGASLACGLWSAACLPLMARLLGTYALIALGMTAFPVLLSAGLPELAPVTLLGGSLLPVVTSLAHVFITRDPVYPLVVCLLTWLAVILYRALRLRPSASELPREALIAIGGLLMVSPQVLPWFFIPLAYFSAFSRNRGWLVFTATAPLIYPLLGDEGGLRFWLGFAQYFPAYFAVIFGWLGRSSSPAGRGGKTR